MTDEGEAGRRLSPSRGLVAAIFPERTQAEDALWDLHEHAFEPGDIGVAMRDRREAREVAQAMAETEAEEGAAIGAVAGGALGGVAGWLVGIGALFIPGLGPILAAGPLATALGGAVLGIATGGLVGALVGEGVPEETARWYEEAIKAGSVLVTVRAGERAAEAREILRRWGGLEDREEETGSASLEGERAGRIHARSELAPEEPPVVASRGEAGPEQARPEGTLAGRRAETPAAARSSWTTAEPGAIQRGWSVYGSDGVQLGVVREVAADRLLVDRGQRLEVIDVPLGAVRRTDQGAVYLDTPSDQIERRGWARTRPSLPQREESRSMSDIGRTARQMTGTAQESMRHLREGGPEEAVGGMLSAMENIPTSTYYYLTLGSILTSAWLFLSGRRWEGIFVGLWAPTFITAGLFSKLLHPSREHARQ